MSPAEAPAPAVIGGHGRSATARRGSQLLQWITPAEVGKGGPQHLVELQGTGRAGSPDDGRYAQ
ncbi:hypothetical protein [Streptomyces sp. NPDC050548]|uniref:hypothetical protein n=1 Tax=Streptomyces sp. NPDC050548 TaxID=3365629 RepID=UPI0037A4E069